MATLEDKILGEKLEYYCSSDDEGENDNETDDEDEGEAKIDPIETSLKPAHSSSGTGNTGPKGVIRDWQRYKQLETEKREEQERERIRLANKLSITCRSSQEDELADDAELDELLSDPYLLEYTQLRMKELLSMSTAKAKFGEVIHLKRGEEYLDAIDKEDEKITIILHVFEENNTLCRIMNGCLDDLSKVYKSVKFCKMSASAAGLSAQFRRQGIPALLVYKAGQLVGNFVQLSNEFENEFNATDVESFLIEKGVVLENPLGNQIGK